MFARATFFEVDTMRIDLDRALERFTSLVVPELKKQPGYEGAMVMDTEDGNGLLITLWRTKEEADAGVTSGFYDEQVGKFIAFFREPASRRLYEVVYSDTPHSIGV